ncbi:hypothetical protein Tco_0774920 [Tanacetum coccineum]|uniref:Reverse transcriptase domain-containing protein n=1 Tax=Tanacetum coccineum TaxID=301880 RepID=A0ABQ4ZPV9_9ASTR
MFHDLYLNTAYSFLLDMAYRSSLCGCYSEVKARIHRIFLDGYDIFPFIAEKVHNEKLKDVRSRLTYREDTEHETKSASCHQKRKRRGGRQKEIQKSPSPSRSRRAKRQEQRRNDARELIQSYVTCSIERQWENEREYQRREWEDSRGEPLESEDSSRGSHWKKQSRKIRKGEGEDLSKPYDKESTTSFTRRFNKFVFPKRIQMPSTIKTYDGTGDPEDHLKNFHNSRQGRKIGNAHLVPHV